MRLIDADELKEKVWRVSLDTREKIANMANDWTKRDGQWWSLSRLVRDILVKAIEAEKTHEDLRKALFEATGEPHGRA